LLLLLLGRHSPTVDATRGQIEVLLLVVIVKAAGAVGGGTATSTISATCIPVPAVPEMTVSDGHCTHVVDGDAVVGAAALLLHGPLLDVVRELCG